MDTKSDTAAVHSDVVVHGKGRADERACHMGDISLGSDVATTHGQSA